MHAPGARATPVEPPVVTTSAPLDERAPHPAGPGRDRADGRCAGARRAGPDPLDRRGERRRHQQHPRRTVRRPLGRHRQPRARHLLPHAGGDAALGRARPARDRPGPRGRAAAGLGALPPRSPVGPDRVGGGQHRGGVSGDPARAVLRSRLRCRSDGCGARDRLRRSPGVRSAHPDPGGRCRGSRLRVGCPGRGAGPGAHPVPPHPPQRRRAARRLRHHRRRRRAALVRRTLLPRPGGPVTQLRLGPAPLRRHRLDLRQPGCRARPRHGRAARGPRVQPVRRDGRQGLRGATRRGHPPARTGDERLARDRDPA